MHGRGEQPLRIRMPRRSHDLARGRGLHEAAGIHHRDAVGDLRRGADIVRDEHDRHAEFLLQLAQQQQDLDLHRDIQRGGRLVGQQHGRRAGERQRDHRALPHAAGHFVRIVLQPPRGRGDLHMIQQVQRTLHRGGAGRCPRAARSSRRSARRWYRPDRAPPSAPGRSSRSRRRAASPVPPRACRVPILPVQPDVAFGVRVVRQQAHQRLQADALAGAGLAQDGQCLAARQCERHAVHRGNVDAAAAEPHRQVLDAQHRRFGRHDVRHGAPAVRLRQMAGDEMRTGAVLAIQRRGQRRHQFGADRLGERAARAEAAAGRRIDRIGRIAGQRHLGGAPIRIQCRLGGEQRARIGMARARVDRLHRTGFDHAAEIHHQHAVADILDDVEVVADEQVGQVEPCLQFATAGSAPAPRSTCRARRPPRRESPAAAPARARARCSRAGAGRRTVRADSAVRTAAG